jgi:alpha-beta hydrolase superfamily lysophospholipase
MLPNFSNDRVKVYAGRNPGLGGDEVVFSIRGTKITDANDLVADVGVFHNKLKEDKTYQEVKHQLRRILAAKGIRVVVVGHSLGGSMAIELLTDPEFINQIEAVYAFNPGVGYKRFIADMKNKLLCRGLGLKFLRRCKELEIIRKKLKVFTTGRDPISLLSYASPGRITTVKPNSINTHGISNFTKLHPDTVENSLLEGEPEAPEEPIANMEAPQPISVAA